MREIKQKFLSEPSEDNGAWEIWLFAIVFVLIFCVVANAEARSSKAAAGREAGWSQWKTEQGLPVAKPAAGRGATPSFDSRAGVPSPGTVSTKQPQGQLVASSSSVKADSTLVTKQPSQPSTEPKRFGLKLGLESSTTLQEQKDYYRAAENAFLLAPSFKLVPELTLSAQTALVQSTTGEEKGDTKLTNTKVTLAATPLVLNRYMKLGSSVSGTMPTDERTSHEQTYRGSVGAGARLLFDLNPARLPVTASYGLSGERNFHEYTLSREGKANLEYSVTNSLGLSWSVWRGLSLSGAGSFVSAWTYRGFVRNRFEISETVSYDVDPSWSVYLSHSNGGTAYKYATRDSNIDLFDKNASAIAGGLTYVY